MQHFPQFLMKGVSQEKLIFHQQHAGINVSIHIQYKLLAHRAPIVVPGPTIRKLE
jgi:hypothetical protein